MSRLKCYHLQVREAFPGPPTNSASATSLTGSWVRSSQERLHWIHTQDASPSFSWPPYIVVKCQDLKTWVRVSQRQECQRPQRSVGPVSSSLWPSTPNSWPAKQSGPSASAWDHQLINTQEKVTNLAGIRRSSSEICAPSKWLITLETQSVAELRNWVAIEWKIDNEILKNCTEVQAKFNSLQVVLVGLRNC